MTLRTFTKPHTIDQICKILLKREMYIDGWTLQDWYDDKSMVIRSITVCWSNRRLVGVFVTTNKPYDVNSCFYVLESYRRRGIGSLMFGHNRCHPINKDYKYRFGSGIPGSYYFLHEKAGQTDKAEVLF